MGLKRSYLYLLTSTLFNFFYVCTRKRVVFQLSSAFLIEDLALIGSRRHSRCPKTQILTEYMNIDSDFLDVNHTGGVARHLSINAMC